MPLGTVPPLESSFGFLAPLARVADAVADDLRAMLAPLGAAKIKSQNRPNEEAATLAFIKEVNEALTKGAELLALMRQVARTGGDIDRIPVDDVVEQVRDYVDTARDAINYVVKDELTDLRKAVRRHDGSRSPPKRHAR